MSKGKPRPVYTCAPKYRTEKSQEMVHKGHGKTVVVEYIGRTVEYPGVFAPDKYMKTVVDFNKGDVIATWVKGDMDNTIIRLAR